jgi:hypothetical protein
MRVGGANFKENCTTVSKGLRLLELSNIFPDLKEFEI